MNLEFLKRLVKVLALLASCMTTACSRTVEWSEEVLLNTGELIQIERSMPWEFGSEYGNPAEIVFKPTYEGTLRFSYRGRAYEFRDRVAVRWLAISPQGSPVLVAQASPLGWARRNTYFCVVPYYVQFEPDASGTKWNWPAQIEAWLYGMDANVMGNIPTPEEPNARLYSVALKKSRDTVTWIQSPAAARVDPAFADDGCIHKP